MKILHISDTHIGGESHFDKDALEKGLKESQNGEFDLLIHSGDVTQDGKLKNYLEARKFFDRLDIPYVVIPGNHDKRSGGISLFEEYLGETYGVKEVGDAVVIHIDSALPDTDVGRVGKVKFDMMKEALNEHNKKGIKIVAVHHHTLPIPMAGRERNVLSNAGDLLDLFLRADVDLVLSGHRHYPNVYRVENTVFVNAGTISGMKTRHGDKNSYNVIEIEKNKLRVRTKRIGNSTTHHEYPRRDKRIFHEFGEKKMRIAHVSNTFISSSTNFRHTHFLNAIKKINDLNVDVVVHCGGVVEEGIEKNYELTDEYISRIQAPLVFTPAGRDINYLGYELFPHYFGDVDQSYEGDDVFLQGVSSSQYDSRAGIIGETERDELFLKLEQRENSFKGVFLHHNVLPIPHAREKGLLEDSGDFLRELVDEEIDLVLTGTSSHPFSAKIGNTIVVNANSMSSVYQRSVYGNSFNLIDIYEKVVVVSEINSLWGTRRIVGIWDRNGLEE
ncbi:MAG: metallophosphoesterase family protein [Candidatus Natronoplasma sp.]